jgi:hypothetical protein
LREISGDGRNFGVPRAVGGVIRSVVPWSRIFNDHEVLLAINTDFDASRAAWVTVDAGIHAAGGQLACLYSTDPGQINATTTVEPRNGRAVHIAVPAAGFVIYA